MAVVLGITGGIATGKSTVLAMFAEMGAEVMDADEIAREVLAHGSAAANEVVEAFGPSILGDDGKIDRRRLGSFVFKDEAALKRLNAITHPRIISILEERIALFREKHSSDNSVLAVEIPLLIECDLSYLVDKVIVVASEQAAQIRRLTMRSSLSAREAAQRVAAQMPVSEKKKYGDWVIYTDCEMEETHRQVERVWRQLEA